MAGLEKDLGTFDLIAMAMGTMIGAGIFSLSGIAASNTGPSVIVSFVFAGAVAAFTSLSYIELATMFSQSGGAYVFARKALGDLIGFLVGWSVWFGYVGACAIYVSTFAEYMSHLFGVEYFLSILLIAVLIGIVNFFGSKASAKVQLVILAVILGILFLLVAASVFHINASNLSPFFPKGLAEAAKMSGMLFITFLGFELVSNVAGEVKNPEKNIPRAIVASIGIVTLIYVSVGLMITGVIHYSLLTETAVMDVAEIVLGATFGGLLLGLAALLSTASSFNGSLTAGSRIGFAMSKDDLFFKPFSRVHKKYSTPYISILVMLVLIIVASSLDLVSLLAYVTNALFLMVFLVVNICLMVLRYTHPEMERSFKVPFVPVLPIAGMFFIGLMLLNIPFVSWIAVFILFTTGFVAFMVRKVLKKK